MTSSLFCDGACSGNGSARARGGWAWAWWAGPVAGEPTVARADLLDTPPAATNQRAELTALLEALRWWATPTGAACGGGGGPVTIYTDSMYTINCTTVWGPGWRRRGWTRSSGEPLQNLDLIRPLVELWKPEWRLVHVRGHQTGTGPLVTGNNWVDRAAVLAAQESPTALDRRALTGVTAVGGAGVSPAATPGPRHVTAIPFPVTAPGPAPAARPIQRRVVGQSADLRNWFGFG